MIIQLLKLTNFRNEKNKNVIGVFPYRIFKKKRERNTNKMFTNEIPT